MKPLNHPNPKKRYLSVKIFSIMLIVTLTILSGGCKKSGGNETPQPVINKVDPLSGKVGTEVKITGSGFGRDLQETVIYFNETKAGIDALSNEEIETSVPEGASTGAVRVIVEGVEAKGSTFNVEEKEPEPTTGNLEVIVQTSGDDIDENGYMVSLNSGSGTSSAVNDTVLFNDIEEGPYQVTLSGLADNCSVDADNPKSISIKASTTTSLNFNVTCTLEVGFDIPLNNMIVFSGKTDGAANLQAVNPDGTGLVAIATDEENMNGPDVSPDGKEVVYYLGAQSPSVWKLTTSGKQLLAEKARSPSWSPDGSKIVYTSREEYTIYTMNADGTNKSRVTTDSKADRAVSPSYSPDGNSILFKCKVGFGNRANQLCVVNTDGTDLVQLTSDDYTYSAPSWSPDGSKIAFHAYNADNSGGNTRKIYTVDADGSNLTQVTEFEAYHPTWSPDGSKIAYHAGKVGYQANTNLFVINPDGTGREEVPGIKMHILGAGGIAAIGGNGAPDWGPSN